MGFLGSNLTRKLLQSPLNTITIIDDQSSGSLNNLSNLPSSDFYRIRIIKKDVCALNFGDIEAKLDIIYHLASRASPRDFLDYPLEIMYANSFGTQRVLELTRQHKSKLIFTSTSEVYGDPLIHPQDETYSGNVNLHGIRSCYDESKRFAETLIAAHTRKYNLDTVILRIFNTYGPGMKIDDGRVIPNFIISSLVDKSIKINGDGRQTRSFCYVDDLVNGMIDIAQLKNNQADVYNIGNDAEITINELAHLILTLTQSDSEIIYGEQLSDDPLLRRPILTKIRSKIKYQPQISLEEGLKRTIAYLADQMGMSHKKLLEVKI
ncbi:MAG: NAD-dependent epimerase/dehydratase family protein [Candidatus Heimdallarchaeota archaeon]|nr:NAD-dependent epimerase/dehydratase family protein [Candidatus Heimdallarchaeota archaeon]